MATVVNTDDALAQQPPTEGILDAFIKRKSEFYIDPEVVNSVYRPILTPELRLKLKQARDNAEAPTDKEEGGSPTKKMKLQENEPTSSGFTDLFIKVDPVKTVEPQISRALPPWCTSAYRADIVGFHNEIIDCINYLSLTDDEIQCRLLIIDEIESYIKEIYPNAVVKVFGSLMNGLSTSFSDIDIGVCNVVNVPRTNEEKAASRDQYVIVLDNIYRHLQSKNAFIHYIDFLKTASVPIIKCKYKNTNIGLDISLNCEDAIRTTNTIRKLQVKYPFSGPLAVIIKYYLLQRDLNNVYNGGLSSFSIYLLCVAFMDYWIQNNKLTKHNINLGILLIDFLRFYSKMFNYSLVGIAFTPKLETKFYAKESPDEFLTLWDPDNIENNLSKASRRINNIVSVFELSYNLLLLDMPQNPEKSDCQKMYNRPTRLSRIINVDYTLPTHRETVRRLVENREAGTVTQRSIIASCFPCNFGKKKK